MTSSKWGDVVFLVLTLCAHVCHSSPAQCDVSTNKVNAFTYDSFDGAQDDFKIIQLASLTAQGAIQLTKQEKDGGVAGYFWLRERQRVSDGFLASYNYRADGEGDGFAFVVQNDRIKNLNGGSGGNLGADGVNRALTVGVDFCPNRRTTGCSGDVASLVVRVRDVNGTEVSTAVEINESLNDGNDHSVSVMYSNYQQRVLVFLDGRTDASLTFDLGRPLENYLETRFAYLGFTGSTSRQYTANQFITSFSLDQLPPGAMLVKTPRTVEWESSVAFSMVLRDACLNQLPTGEPGLLDRIEARLVEQTDESLSPVVLLPNLKDNGDGSYALEFSMPIYKVAKWTLVVVVDDVEVTNSPYVNAVETTRPTVFLGGMEPWLFGLLIALLLLLIFAVAFVVYRVQQYRKKLKENEEFIKAGQEQQRLDDLEIGVSYAQNPLLGSIEELKAQLAKHEAELNALKGRDPGNDDEFTLDQLERQRDELLAEMNRLKKEEQELEAEKSTFTAGDSKLGRKRVEFNPQNINDDF